MTFERDPYSSDGDRRMEVIERELARVNPLAGIMTGHLAGRMGELRAEVKVASSWELDNFEDFLDDVDHQLAILTRWVSRIRAVTREAR
jgi:hypothetical protein